MKKSIAKKYDVAIIGAGPAGLMAAVYTGRYKLKTIVFGEIFGGTLSQAHIVCNFPTYTSIPGFEIGQKMVAAVKDLGIKIRMEKVDKITKKGNEYELVTSEGKTLAKKVIIAIGRKRVKLGIPKETALTGKGVSYCATCDGTFFKDKIVSVIGGGDAALSSAVLLADIAKKVYIIYRKDKFFRAEPAWIELVEKNPKIIKIFNANVKEFIGNKFLQGVKLDTGKKIKLDGLFIEIGSIPQKEFFESIGIALDENSYVLADSKMRTSVKGIFTAGDLNAGNFKQAVVAVAEGAIAANTAYEEIKREGIKKIKQ